MPTPLILIPGLISAPTLWSPPLPLFPKNFHTPTPSARAAARSAEHRKIGNS